MTLLRLPVYDDKPFRVQAPALISFSGGRTSGYMLWRILRAHGGELPNSVHVLFANTGKERPETLDFVRDCAERWKVRVVWVERDPCAPRRFYVVSHATAHRSGEPFARLIDDKSFLPNPVMRFCTQHLKLYVLRDWMKARGISEWTSYVGIRADEPSRVAKLKDRSRHLAGEIIDVSMPLARAGVTVGEVRAFWNRQPFDLHLRPWEGNCDLCFLKGRAKRERVMRDRPDLASWWVGQEHDALAFADTGAYFRSDTPSYAALLAGVKAQPMLIPDEPACDLTDLGDCECDLEAA